MALTYNTLFEDDFQRANESPLNPSNYFEVGGGLPHNDVLQLVNHVCTTTVQVEDDGTAIIKPIGQQQNGFIQVKISRCVSNAGVFLYLGIPPTATDVFPGYALVVRRPSRMQLVL